MIYNEGVSSKPANPRRRAKLARVAILSDEDIPRVDGWNPLEKANDVAARALGLRSQWLKVKGPTPDLETLQDIKEWIKGFFEPPGSVAAK